MLEALVDMSSFVPFEDNTVRLSTVILALYRPDSYCQISVIKIGMIGGYRSVSGYYIRF